MNTPKDLLATKPKAGLNRRRLTQGLWGAALWGSGPMAWAQLGEPSKSMPTQKDPEPHLVNSVNSSNTDLYLLIGQSNMAGRGTVEDEDRVVHERVFNFNKEGAVVPAVDPLHFDKPKVCGVGPGRTFGLQVALAHPSKNILLVPCAVGGTSIEVWQAGAYDPDTHTHPYDDMVKRVVMASALGQWKGVLWHQGSSDANAKRANGYYPKLLELVHQVRTLLQAPEIPFLIGQMLDDPIKPWNEYYRVVDAAHQAVCRENPNMAYVSAADLKAKRNDIEHFDSASARILGQRYAQEYLKIA
jgi:Carbohydrate esterase, sialic acid-specific acetylesterase